MDFNCYLWPHTRSACQFSARFDLEIKIQLFHFRGRECHLKIEMNVMRRCAQFREIGVWLMPPHARYSRFLSNEKHGICASSSCMTILCVYILSRIEKITEIKEGKIKEGIKCALFQYGYDKTNRRCSKSVRSKSGYCSHSPCLWIIV